ncbi:hypothetical protein Q3G72_018955 [Acer saccharum]|nr:hypothetical protein Q3G72_018955 [Acer saccharum]
MTNEFSTLLLYVLPKSVLYYHMKLDSPWRPSSRAQDINKVRVLGSLLSMLFNYLSIDTKHYSTINED